MYGEKFTEGVAYCVANSAQSYNIGNDALVVKYIPRVNHIVNGMVSFGYVRFYEFL